MSKTLTLKIDYDEFTNLCSVNCPFRDVEAVSRSSDDNCWSIIDDRGCRLFGPLVDSRRAQGCIDMGVDK